MSLTAAFSAVIWYLTAFGALLTDLVALFFCTSVVGCDTNTRGVFESHHETTNVCNVDYMELLICQKMVRQETSWALKMLVLACHMQDKSNYQR